MNSVPSVCPKCQGPIVLCAETRRSLFGGTERNVGGSMSTISCGNFYCPKGHWMLSEPCPLFGPACPHTKGGNDQ
jgi:hypothetical protein